MPVRAETESGAAPAAGEETTAGVKQPTFAILEYQVEGNTVLPASAVEHAVYPHLGGHRTIADVELARKSLEQTYQKAGYSTVFVDIPEQDVVNGVVRLRVTEGRVGRVRVTGSRYYSLGRIRSQVPALAPGSVPYLPDVQEQLSAANTAAADRRITPVFRAGRTPGTVDVELKVRDQPPWHASLEMNNRYSANTTHTRASGELRYDNLWQREHSLSLQYQTAPEDTDEVRVASATYLFRSEQSNQLTALYAVRSRSNVAAIGDITVIGSGDILGARRIVPLTPGRRLFHSLAFGVDLKDFDESLLQGTDSTTETPIRYIPLSLAYNASLPGEFAANQFSAALNFSLRTLSEKRVDCFGQEVDQFECKRFKARPNYLYLKADYKHSRKFLNGMSVSARLSGQLADQPLISNEQFSAGGAESVRGYTEAQQLGDYGAQASFELSTRPFAPAAYVQELRLLAFVDGATLRLNDAQPEQQSRFDFLGAGLGARWTLWDSVHGSMDWARAFKDVGAIRSGDKRLHFRLEYRF